MPKRIFIIARKFDVNGGSYAGFIENFSKHCHKQSYEVIILAGKHDNEKEDEDLGYAKIKRFSLSKYKFPLLGMNTDYIALGRKIKEYFKKEELGKEDIILANSRAALGVLDKKYTLRMNQPAFVFLENMEIAKYKVSFVTRIARYFHFLIQSKIEKACVKNASSYVFPSLETRNLNHRYYGNKKPYFLPEAGVDYNFLNSSKKNKSKTRHILFVSSGEEKIRKGIVYLEEALPILFSKHKDLKLIHVGSKFEWKLPGWCKERIVSTGNVDWDKMKKYYKSADVLVMTALSEGIPNVLLEGMASGIPIVTSDINGIGEYIKHMKSGYIYKRGDVSGLVKGIDFMLETPKKSKAMADASKKIAKKLDYPLFSQALLEFLEKNNKQESKDYNLLN
jgi:glycosyltransferase involved in cell wall biosynthesis